MYSLMIRIVSSFLLIIPSLVLAQNRLVYVFNQDFIELQRVYQLDGYQSDNPFFSQLITYVNQDSIQPARFFSPFTVEPEGIPQLPFDAKLQNQILWQSSKDQNSDNQIYLLANRIFLLKKKDNSFFLFQPDNQPNQQPLAFVNPSEDSIFSSSLEPLFHNPTTTTYDQDRGFAVNQGKIVVFGLKKNDTEIGEVVMGIPQPCLSVRALGNNKLVYIHDGRAAIAEINNQQVTATYNLKIRGKDKLHNNSILLIEPNPVDPSIAAVITQGTENNESPNDTNRVYCLAIGYMNFSKKILHLEITRPQNFIKDRIIISCSWSPDGQNLAFLTGSREKFNNEGTGLLTLMPFDMRMRKASPYRYFRRDEQYVKASAGLVWSPDGAHVFFVEKDRDKEYLAYVDNRVKRHYFWEPVVNDKNIYPITSITGPTVKPVVDKQSLEIYISGKIGTSSVICRTRDHLPYVKPSGKGEIVTEKIFNRQLSSVDEVLAFEKKLSGQKKLSNDGSINILNSLKGSKATIENEILQQAFQDYCQGIIEDLAPPEAANPDYSEMTLTDLQEIHQVQEGFSSQKKEILDNFINQRKKYLRTVFKVEKKLNDLKSYPASMYVSLDSLVVFLLNEVAESIKNGQDLTQVLTRIATIKYNLKGLYRAYTVFDEYYQSYQKTHTRIKEIMLSSSEVNNNALEYLAYLNRWDSTFTAYHNQFCKSMTNLVLSEKSLSSDLSSATNSQAEHPDTIINHFKSLGQPLYFSSANDHYTITGDQGLNEYFSLDKRHLIISAGSSMLVCGLGMMCHVAGKQNYDRYNAEKWDIYWLNKYRQRTTRFYALGRVFYGLGLSGIGYTTYYLTNYLIKRKRIKIGLTINPESFNLVWSY